MGEEAEEGRGQHGKTLSQMTRRRWRARDTVAAEVRDVPSCRLEKPSRPVFQRGQEDQGRGKHAPLNIRETIPTFYGSSMLMQIQIMLSLSPLSFYTWQKICNYVVKRSKYYERRFGGLLVTAGNHRSVSQTFFSTPRSRLGRRHDPIDRQRGCAAFAKDVLQKDKEVNVKGRQWGHH